MTMSTVGFALTDEERELLPSDEDVAFYAEHGWYLTKKLFTDDGGRRAGRGQRAVLRRGARPPAARLRPPRLAYWEPAHGAVQRHNDYVHYESDAHRRSSCASRCSARSRPGWPRPTRSGSSSRR